MEHSDRNPSGSSTPPHDPNDLSSWVSGDIFALVELGGLSGPVQSVQSLREAVDLASRLTHLEDRVGLPARYLGWVLDLKFIEPVWRSLEAVGQTRPYREIAEQVRCDSAPISLSGLAGHPRLLASMEKFQAQPPAQSLHVDASKEELTQQLLTLNDISQLSRLLDDDSRSNPRVQQAILKVTEVSMGTAFWIDHLGNMLRAVQDGSWTRSMEDRGARSYQYRLSAALSVVGDLLAGTLKPDIPEALDHLERRHAVDLLFHDVARMEEAQH